LNHPSAQLNINCELSVGIHIVGPICSKKSPNSKRPITNPISPYSFPSPPAVQPPLPLSARRTPAGARVAASLPESASPRAGLDTPPTAAVPSSPSTIYPPRVHHPGRVPALPPLSPLSSFGSRQPAAATRSGTLAACWASGGPGRSCWRGNGTARSHTPGRGRRRLAPPAGRRPPPDGVLGLLGGKSKRCSHD
jgi:hypothetical protein